MRKLLAVVLPALVMLAGCEAVQEPKEETTAVVAVEEQTEEAAAERESQLRSELAERLSALVEKRDDPVANHRVAFKYYQLGELIKAREYWNAAIAADPKFVKAHFNLAGVDFREGKSDAAVERWEKVLALDFPDALKFHASAHYNIGCVDYGRGISSSDRKNLKGADEAFQMAVKRYRKALELNPDHYKALINLGLALVELHSDEEAADAWTRAVKLNPQSFHGNYNLGLLKAAAGVYKEALTYCKAAVDGDDFSAQSPEVQAAVYYTLGELYVDLGDRDRSIEAFKKSIELDESLENTARQRLRAVIRKRHLGK